MTSHANGLPTAAKWAFGLTVGIGCLSLVFLIFNPVFGLMFAACSFAFARGIRKRQAWAAIAAASFCLIPIPIMVLRGAIVSVDVAVMVIFQAGIGLVMLMAAAAFWPDPVSRVPVWPWVVFVLVLTAQFAWFPAFVQPSASMMPTLLIGDQYFVDRGSWALGRTPKRGDIVAFHYPLNREMIYVKRIVGIPGDLVSLHNRVLYINGKAVSEPYAIHSQSTVNEYRDNFPKDAESSLRPRAADMLSVHVHGGELVVPTGSYFTLGDNRDDSDDSRYWGLVGRDDIVGSPVLIYGSYDVPTIDMLSPSMPPTLFSMRWNRMFKRI